jgi:hypothetical protein
MSHAWQVKRRFQEKYRERIPMSKSEVATFRAEQALQEQAAWQGLYGLAAVARHDAIIARMDQQGERLLKLIAAGKHAEVARLMNTPDWGAGRESEEMSHYDGTR